MTKILRWLDAFLWGAPALVLILGVGIFLSLRLGLVQLRLFPQAVRVFVKNLLPGQKNTAGVSGYRALCTALAATVGTGNLVGVAGAICLGGPGAVFWMWISGILGMVTKYAETVLALRFRVPQGDTYVGGPMYVIVHGLERKYHCLAVCYSAFGLVAAFGVGNAAQINAVMDSVGMVIAQNGKRMDRAGMLLISSFLALLIGILLFGGAKRIGVAAERLVPFAAGSYILLCCGALIKNADAVPSALSAVFRGAVSPRAVTGGALGSAFLALRVGCARGVFTNEAGMGTASIAHASAAVSQPAQQGLMGMMEVFLDTILICTLTALVILTSGVPIPYGNDAGANLTSLAFASVYGDAAVVFLAAELILFAVATVLGWSLYGARCAEFLFGPRAWKWFAAAQTVVAGIGAMLDTAAVWQISEILNGLMVIPNLIMLALLAPEVSRLTKEYRKSG